MLWIAMGAALILLLILAFSYAAFRIAFYNPLPHREDIHAIPHGSQYRTVADQITALVDAFDALPFQPVSAVSHDGLPLYARYYKGDGQALDIAFHGYRSTGIRDFCGGARIALDAGHDLLLIDERSHGQSGGTVITFGVRERLDCLTWIEWAREHVPPELPIFLDGVSMGAATVLMAADLPLSDQVAGILADCPYSSPAAIIRKVCGDLKLPAGPVMPFVRLGARLFGRFSLDGAAAISAVRQAKIPVLIIHGQEDRFVPHAMGQELFDACASDDKAMLSVPGAGHALSYLVEPEQYRQAVTAFYDRALAQRKERTVQP